MYLQNNIPDCHKCSHTTEFDNNLKLIVSLGECNEQKMFTTVVGNKVYYIIYFLLEEVWTPYQGHAVYMPFIM